MATIRNWKTGEVIIQLRSNSLRGESLQGIDLSWADLEKRNLSGANLQGARLAHAKLQYAILKSVNLEGADLRVANLAGANVYKSNLIGCNLSRVILTGTILDATDVSYAKFYRTTFGYTRILACDTLHLALRLETIRHRGPSTIDQFTMRSCVPHLPDIFLEGIGYNNKEIKYLRDLHGALPMQYFSCFISHAKADSEFVEKLYKDLRAHNITCWHYVHDMRGGLEWREQIAEAIKSHDKLILVCSRHSIYSPNVVMEILKAIDNERAGGVKKLFPIRLDDHILSTQMMEEAREKVRSGEWRENWVYYITQYHIPNFAEWKDSRIYTVEFQKLLDALTYNSQGSA